MEGCIIKRSPGLGRVMKHKRRRGAPRKGLKRSQRRRGELRVRLGSGASCLLCSWGSG